VEARNSWRSLLLSITKAKKRVLLEWIITDGTCFKMLLPSEEEFAESTFQASLEFPYDFDEIEEVTVVQAVPGFALPEEEIRAMEKLASHFDAFQCTRRQDGGLTIRTRMESDAR
jgi:hypothetical protein